jgi:hypothetical protein
LKPPPPGSDAAASKLMNGAAATGPGRLTNGSPIAGRYVANAPASMELMLNATPVMKPVSVVFIKKISRIAVPGVYVSVPVKLPTFDALFAESLPIWTVAPKASGRHAIDAQAARARARVNRMVVVLSAVVSASRDRRGHSGSTARAPGGQRPVRFA